MTAKKKTRHVPEVAFPTRADTPSDVRIAVAVTREERAEWQAAAYAQGVTLSDVAREAWARMARKAAR